MPVTKDPVHEPVQSFVVEPVSQTWRKQKNGRVYTLEVEALNNRQASKNTIFRLCLCVSNYGQSVGSLGIQYQARPILRQPHAHCFLMFQIIRRQS